VLQKITLGVSIFTYFLVTEKLQNIFAAHSQREGNGYRVPFADRTSAGVSWILGFLTKLYSHVI
jgi:hypothetical protein